MKSIPSFRTLVTALAFGCIVSAASAQDVELKPKGSSDVLVASKIVNPSSLPYDFTRSVLDVRFSLDENGQPQNVRVVSPTDDKVKKQVVKAFKEWRFDVATLDRGAGAKRFVLPLDIIPEV